LGLFSEATLLTATGDDDTLRSIRDRLPIATRFIGYGHRVSFAFVAQEALARAIASPSCASCHSIIDPPGWSLEHFDATGAYGDTDNGKPVDSSGLMRVYGNTVGTQDSEYTFKSIDDLAPQLATSCVVAACFTRSMMNRAFNVVDTSGTLPYTDAEVNHVANRFANGGFSIRELVKAIVETPSFLK